jgi:hypothetical protein
MAWRERIRAILAGVLVVVAFQALRGAYDWFAHSGEREILRALNPALDSAAVRVVTTQIEAERIRRTIAERDERLGEVRRAVMRYEAQAVDGAIPERIYAAYRRRLAEYNGQVRERNAWLVKWREVLDANEAAVNRYAVLADSIRAVATRMGDAYYEVPPPMELAARHGLLPPRPDSAGALRPGSAARPE